MKLSANFQLSELVKSQVAERKGISNNPSPAHIDNLKALCVNVLQPIRSQFDAPVLISSGYRSGELNIAMAAPLNHNILKARQQILKWLEPTTKN
jgi:zinc D-Ala-D-Ala carboxypeptidase